MGTRAETMAAEIAEAEKQIFSKPTVKATEDKVKEVVEATPTPEEVTVTQLADLPEQNKQEK